jgi:putative FmdB family regulatory protein
MPIYEYRAKGKGCPTCTRGFEALQGIHEEALKTCPHCLGKVEKVISRIGRIDVAYTPSDAFKHYTKQMEERQRKREEK